VIQNRLIKILNIAVIAIDAGRWIELKHIRAIKPEELLVLISIMRISQKEVKK
jgi:hypothetical protein|tara:strand:- start:1296 stop:1454 length:159 start_codon:yes stop_codon:yes gene_type:complete